MTDSAFDLKLAVLIDADNATPSTLAAILTDIARHGTAYVRRIYGNWASSNLNGWQPLIHEHALTPMQQFAVTAGKNATDSALIIDAMDLLYSGRFGGFCIVSSDSDFSRLASRLRESGLRVWGYGRSQTPISFRRACDEFVDVGLLTGTQAPVGSERSRSSRSKAQAAPDKPAAKRGRSRTAVEPETIAAEPAPDASARVPADLLLASALRNIEGDDDGFVHLGELSTMVRRLDPEFDVRAYGYNQFLKLVRQQKWLEMQARDIGGGAQYFVRAIDDDRGEEAVA